MPRPGRYAPPLLTDALVLALVFLCYMLAVGFLLSDPPAPWDEVPAYRPGPFVPRAQGVP